MEELDDEELDWEELDDVCNTGLLRTCSLFAFSSIACSLALASLGVVVLRPDLRVVFFLCVGGGNE